MEQGKSVSSAPRKPPALREVVAALAHNSVRAFSCSSSSQAPYPSFPPKRAKTRSFRCSSSPPANPLRWALPGSPFSLRSSPNPSGKPRWDRNLTPSQRRTHSPTQAVKRGDPPFAKGNRPAAETSGCTRPTQTQSPNGTSPPTAESGAPPFHNR